MKGIQIRAQADRRAEVLLYDMIGEDYWTGNGITAKSFAEQLQSLGELDEINLRINSPGGSVHDALAIYSTLTRHPAKVIVDIEGLAASAASFIAMAGDEIRMVENGIFMIHLSQGQSLGDHREMAKTAEILQQHDSAIAQTYAKRSGRKPETLLKLMEQETWMTAQETMDHKLCDSITPCKKMQACFDQGLLGKLYHKVPADIADRLFLIGNVVPSNPSNGSGEGVEGEWEKPTLADFTDKQWGDLSAEEKKKISQHYTWYDALDDFGSLKLPHHFAKGAKAGKASLDGVRNALARLSQTEGMSAEDRDKAKAHLEAHMPAQDDADRDDDNDTTESSARAEAIQVRLRALELDGAD